MRLLDVIERIRVKLADTVPSTPRGQTAATKFNDRALYIALDQAQADLVRKVRGIDEEFLLDTLTLTSLGVTSFTSLGGGVHVAPIPPTIDDIAFLEIGWTSSSPGARIYAKGGFRGAEIVGRAFGFGNYRARSLRFSITTPGVLQISGTETAPDPTTIRAWVPRPAPPSGRFRVNTGTATSLSVRLPDDVIAGRMDESTDGYRNVFVQCDDKDGEGAPRGQLLAVAASSVASWPTLTLTVASHTFVAGLTWSTVFVWPEFVQESLLVYLAAKHALIAAGEQTAAVLIEREVAEQMTHFREHYARRNKHARRVRPYR